MNRNRPYPETGSGNHRVSRKLQSLLSVLSRASIGDFSSDVNIPEEEDEFTELYVGVQVMLEVIREKISELERLNRELERKVIEKTAALEEAQRIARTGSWEWDTVTGRVTWSDEMYRIFGFRQKKPGFTLIDYLKKVHKDDRAMVSAQLEKACKTHKPFSFYHRIRIANKKIRIIHCIGKAARGKKGESLHILGTVQDVTRLKMAERALKETNQRLEKHVERRTRELQKVVQNLHREIEAREAAQKKQEDYERRLRNIAKFPAENPNPILRFSLKDNCVLYTNRPGEGLVSFFTSGRKHRIRKEWRTQFKRIYRTGRVSRREMEIGERVFMCTFVPVPKENYLNFYGDDITAFKAAESEIRKLSIILARTENAITIANRQGKVQWVNEGFVRLSGYTLEDVKGTRGEVLRKGKHTGLYPDNPFFRKMLKEKQSVSYESRNYRKDGSEYWVISTLTPILNAAGELENVVVIDADTTLKKKGEQEIIRAKKMAEESSKAKEQFLANMSHEIRTPMNAIMGMAQLMEDMTLDEKQKEYLRTINFAGKNLLYIINDVLDLAKIESGKMTFEKIEFSLRELVRELINSVSYRAQEKNIQLRCEVDEQVPAALIGDPVRINQVLLNLLSNAIKFTEKGYVKLEVKVNKRTDHTVLLRFNVEDTGIGIPGEKHSQVFQAFEQAHKGTASKYGGTGLGLSIVKRLTELQGGRVWMESTPGIGSVFSVELPLYIGEKIASREKEKHISDDEPVRNKKVLLVEDNALNLMVAEKFLQGYGLQVSTADNGTKAVEKLETEDFDLVLMDIQMPEMNGYEATRYIRTNLHDHKKDIPILAMTAHAIRGEEEKCLESGMNDYISKPLNREVLRDKIIRLLDSKKTAS